MEVDEVYLHLKMKVLPRTTPISTMEDTPLQLYMRHSKQKNERKMLSKTNFWTWMQEKSLLKSNTLKKMPLLQKHSSLIILMLNTAAATHEYNEILAHLKCHWLQRETCFFLLTPFNGIYSSNCIYWSKRSNWCEFIRSSLHGGRKITAPGRS